MGNIDKAITAGGAFFTLGTSGLLVWLHLAAVEVPRPRLALYDELVVCGWDLDTVNRWLELVPMCGLHPRAAEPGECWDKRLYTEDSEVFGNLLVQEHPEDINKGGTTYFWTIGESRIIIAGSYIQVPAGATDYVGAHELCHAAGYEHAVFKQANWLRPKHIMAEYMDDQGPSTKGM